MTGPGYYRNQTLEGEDVNNSWNVDQLCQAQLPWEGPFTVAKMTGPGSYRLQTLEGEDVNNSWNVDQLCRFYA
jgi:hypothetical protein